VTTATVAAPLTIEEYRRIIARDASRDIPEGRPLFTITNIGRRRWFWCVQGARTLHDWLDWSWSDYPTPPLGCGYVPSQEDAIAAVLDCAGPNPWPLPAHYGARFERKLVAKRRGPRKPNTRIHDAGAVEYLWGAWRPHGDYYPGEPDYSEPNRYRIIKKTWQRVYVRREPEQASYDTGTFILDRAALEGDGFASPRPGSNQWWTDSCYYLKRPPHPSARGAEAAPDCLISLGLKSGASKREIAGAYKPLARQHHPDVGGDAESFKALHRAYEEALRLAVPRGGAQ
jgi:hypothetical protein